MDANPTPGSSLGHHDQTDLTLVVAHLIREVERGGMRLQVSFAIRPFVDSAFDYDAPSVFLVVNDIVDLWCALSASDQANYATHDNKFPPVVHFAWDYAEGIDALADDEHRHDLPDNFDLATPIVWREHAQKLLQAQQQRMAPE